MTLVLLKIGVIGNSVSNPYKAEETMERLNFETWYRFYLQVRQQKFNLQQNFSLQAFANDYAPKRFNSILCGVHGCEISVSLIA